MYARNGSDPLAKILAGWGLDENGMPPRCGSRISGLGKLPADVTIEEALPKIPSPPPDYLLTPMDVPVSPLPEDVFYEKPFELAPEFLPSVAPTQVPYSPAPGVVLQPTPDVVERRKPDYMPLVLVGLGALALLTLLRR
jgi:hypothetical protein